MELTGTPFIDWALNQVPAIGILTVIAWRLEGIVREALQRCQDENERLTSHLIEQDKHD